MSLTLKLVGSAVHISGNIDEATKFDALTDMVKSSGATTIDLGGIGRINSFGVRGWLNFVGHIERPLVLENCSPVMVAQLNMVAGFAGAHEVASVLAPFVCDNCSAELTLPLAVRRGQAPQVSPPPCPKCGEPQMAFDDLEDSYFGFLKA